MTATLKNSVETTLGAKLRSVRSLAGGDICQAYLAELDDDRRVFVKTRHPAPKGMFVAEARGLEWLREPGALRIPEVLASDETMLVLEYLDSATRAPGFDETLGEGLAALHRAPTDGYGLDRDNYIGSLPQANQPRPSWSEFYAEQRLRPLVELAVSSRRGPDNWGKRFERLYQALPTLIPDEPPSRLHGDLWGGNMMVGPRGEPCLIDPAAYAGHREVDLAMMRLFGGFSERVFAAYYAAFPLVAGHERRVSLYQLYPLLVHVNLFGGGYVSSVERALDQLP